LNTNILIEHFANDLHHMIQMKRNLAFLHRKANKFNKRAS